MNKQTSKPKTWAEWEDWIDKDFRAYVKSMTIKGKTRTRLMKILKSHGGAKVLS